MRVYHPGSQGADRLGAVPQRVTLLERDIDLRAVTPIYKGAAKKDGIDEAYPFRGPSLRGQLRAWWRAVQTTTSVDRLRQDEHQLFGGVFGGTRASRVSLGLSQMCSTPCTRGEVAQKAGSDLPYALGLVDREPKDRLYHVDAKARLQVVAHAGPDDEITAGSARLDQALRALVLLGGSGGRTRRGLGRLWSDELLGARVEDVQALATLLRSLAPELAARSWPSLAGADVAWKRGERYNTATQAANAALIDLQHLRGMRKVKNGYEGDLRAPEAQRDWSRIRDGKCLEDAFTAALGMPLTYRSVNGHLTEPVTVSPAGRTRLPSPVHVRPVPTGGARWAAVMIVLRPWYQGRIKAKARQKTTEGTLHPDPGDILLRELAKRGWDVIRGDR